MLLLYSVIPYHPQSPCTLSSAVFHLPAVAVKLRSAIDRHGVTLATVLLLLLLAWLLTKATWLFLQPKEVIAPPVSDVKVDINMAAGRVVGANLFGAAGESNPSAEAQVSTLNVRLTGVFAFDQESPSFAIVNTGSKSDEAFKIGDEITPGAVLNEVHPTHILIKRGGALERVNLDERAGGATGGSLISGGGGGGDAGMNMGMIPALPPQLRPKAPTASAQNFSRSELAATMKDPTNMGRVNASPGGGIVVEDVPPNSLAEKLGLQPGDVIRNINGAAVNTPSDLGRLYKQLRQAPQVRVDGVRGDRPLNLTYNMQQ